MTLFLKAVDFACSCFYACQEATELEGDWQDVVSNMNKFVAIYDKIQAKKYLKNNQLGRNLRQFLTKFEKQAEILSCFPIGKNVRKFVKNRLKFNVKKLRKNKRL